MRRIFLALLAAFGAILGGCAVNGGVSATYGYYDYGVASYGRGHYRDALVHFARACDMGHGAACARLGYMYENGRGIPRNLTRSANFYKRACLNGFSGSCSNFSRPIFRPAKMHPSQREMFKRPPQMRPNPANHPNFKRPNIKNDKRGDFRGPKFGDKRPKIERPNLNKKPPKNMKNPGTKAPKNAKPQNAKKPPKMDKKMAPKKPNNPPKSKPQMKNEPPKKPKK